MIAGSGGSVTIGGTRSDVVNPPSSNDPTGTVNKEGFSNVQFTRLERFVDPFTGEVTFRRVLVRTTNSRHGEKVHERINIKS